MRPATSPAEVADIAAIVAGVAAPSPRAAPDSGPPEWLGPVDAAAVDADRAAHAVATAATSALQSSPSSLRSPCTATS